MTTVLEFVVLFGVILAPLFATPNRSHTHKAMNN
jgi:hypothetical protein